jgi:hypothetical protein
VAAVDPRTRTPIYALLLMVVPSIIIAALLTRAHARPSTPCY